MRDADLTLPESRSRTLARLAFRVPVDQMVRFESSYEKQLAPLLKQHGLIASPMHGRATPKDVFSKLFELACPSDVIRKREALRGDSEWQAALTSIVKDGSRLLGLEIYEAPADQGRTVPAGPGRRIPGRPGTGHWRTFDAAAGLVGGGMWALFQDRDGNMWFGGHSDVVRSDGQVFTRFVPDDGITGHSTRSIVQDRSGCLWFSTYGGGVRRYDPSAPPAQAWSRLTSADGLAHDHVWWICETREGHLWFGTEAGASRYDVEAAAEGKEDAWRTFTTEDGLAHDSVAAVMQDRDGCMWFCTGDYDYDGKGVCRYDGRYWQHYTTEDGLTANNVWCAIQDSAGALWFGTRDGVARFDPGDGPADAVVGEAGRSHGTWQSYTADDGLGKGQIFGLVEDREGCVWATTSEGGVSRFDGTGWTTFTTADGLAYDMVVGCYQDREGYLWFGTHSGVSLYEGETFTSFTTDHGLPPNFYGMLRDRDDRLWLGTWTDGLLCQERPATQDGSSDELRSSESWRHFTTRDGLPSNGVVTIHQDRRGDLWLGTKGGGVCRYDGHNFETFGTREGIIGSVVYSILEDRRGDLWFGVENRGVTRYDGSTFKSYTTADGLADGAVYGSAEDTDGHTWFGTCFAGVSRHDPLASADVPAFVTYTTDDGLGSNWNWSALADREGGVWFGSPDSSVSHHKGGRFMAFTPEDGLSATWVRSMAQDRAGHIWFATSGGGANRFDGQVAQTLTAEDGLATNGVTSIYEDRNGDIWFATTGGVTRFRTPPPVPPLVHVDAVVADRRYEGKGEQTLPANVGLVVFEYHGVSMKTRPGAMVYRYRLQGHDDDWQSTRARRVEYEHLPVGSYTFEVQAVDRDLVYSAEAASVQVAIVPDPRLQGLVEALTGSGGIEEFVGNSEAIRRTQAELAEVARTEVTVLIQGETGTGKGLAARAVHGLSDRASGPLVQVNCGAIPEGLVESELFGHEKGAFTGAVSRKLGKVEVARGGTLFLDEIGDLALDAQVKLLRLLEERTYERVGGTETLRTDVRVIAATNRDLEGMVAQRAFREDLYYRLGAFHLRMPPLRERREDIALLATCFMNRMATHLQKDVKGFTPEAMSALQVYAWPGNVRELEHAAQRAVIVCQGDQISAQDLALTAGRAEAAAGSDAMTLEEHERQYIREVLERTKWTVAGPKGAAALLGINPSTLRSRIKKLGIKRR